MNPHNSAADNFASATNGARKRTAPRGGARNRRRAKDLEMSQIREVKRDFDIQRNTLEVAQNHLLPRAEAVDAVLMRHSDELVTVRQELSEIRREMGLGSASQPFLLRRSA